MYAVDSFAPQKCWRVPPTCTQLSNTSEDFLVQHLLNKLRILLSWVENVKSLFSLVGIFLTITLRESKTLLFFLKRGKINKKLLFRNTFQFSAIIGINLAREHEDCESKSAIYNQSQVTFRSSLVSGIQESLEMAPSRACCFCGQFKLPLNTRGNIIRGGARAP